MKKYLSNAFSLQMIAGESEGLLCDKIDMSDIDLENTVSVIGHADTAAVLSTMLGTEIQCNRLSITLERGDIVYVAQLVGGRLPEGATTLPEGFKITFWRVKVGEPYPRRNVCWRSVLLLTLPLEQKRKKLKLLSFLSRNESP